MLEMLQKLFDGATRWSASTRNYPNLLLPGLTDEVRNLLLRSHVLDHALEKVSLLAKGHEQFGHGHVGLFNDSRAIAGHCANLIVFAVKYAQLAAITPEQLNAELERVLKNLS